MPRPVAARYALDRFLVRRKWAIWVAWGAIGVCDSSVWVESMGIAYRDGQLTSMRAVGLGIVCAVALVLVRRDCSPSHRVHRTRLFYESPFRVKRTIHCPGASGQAELADDLLDLLFSQIVDGTVPPAA